MNILIWSPFLQKVGTTSNVCNLIHGIIKYSKHNINSIKVILNHLEIDIKKLKLSSELKQEGSSNELLINLTKNLSCDTYMCGGGAEGYQNIALFEKNNVKLLHQKFEHPVYNQYKQHDFVKGLSIIDCLMNIGWEETSYKIKSG